MADTVVVHPNREKPESKATKAAVTLLLVVSAVLILIILLGGLKVMQGMYIVSVAYIIVYGIMAYVIMKNWNRGVLPLAAGMAIMFMVVAAVAAPAWFSRDKTGFIEPNLPSSILGLLTLILIPVQILLIAFAMRGLNQKWNTEVEVPREELEEYRSGRGGGGEGDLQTA
jgi:presenilin-like A22 family membrane protease